MSHLPYPAGRMAKRGSGGRDGPESAKPSVGPLFDRIAPTYDVLNHVLSFGRDSAWRRRAVKQIKPNGSLRVVDLATGTGDLLIAGLRAHPHIVEAVGLDISEGMLGICRAKIRKRGLSDRADCRCGDVARTGLPPDHFDAATMAFGIRNAADIPGTLAEMYRILKPGGRAIILEFSLPKRALWRWSYLAYLRFLVPRIGGLVSGNGAAYRYLNTSIEAFHSPETFCPLMAQAGFSQVSATGLTFGVASIYQGTKGVD